MRRACFTAREAAGLESFRAAASTFAFAQLGQNSQFRPLDINARPSNSPLQIVQQRYNSLAGESSQ
jgi:hypothetical protein